MEKMKVAAYLKRIGLEMPETVVPDFALLKQLQFAHCTTVPYENLDIIRGIPLSLNEDDLFEKIVTRGQGGFCFELNGLFGWLLRQLGYEVTDVASRYLRGEPEIPMCRHRVLIVKAVDGVWCVDVGIGEVSPRYPVWLEEGLEQPQFDECYRFDKDPFLGWVLMDKHHGEWRRFYSFTEEPKLIVDFIAPTFYCEKHPDSPFFPNEMFSMKTSKGRFTLDGHVFKEFVDGNVFVRELAEEELPEAYRKFGLNY
jgi:N-hydroxyarylamine O-acetyltransferase